MEEKRQIGIIMEKKILDKNTSLLIPKTIEYGTLVNYKGYQYFEVQKEKGKECFLFADDITTNSSEEPVVSFAIEEEGLLLQKNSKVSLEGALNLYIEKMKDQAYLSYFEEGADKLKLEKISLDRAHELLRQLEEYKTTEKDIEIQSGNDLEKIYNEATNGIRKCENFQEIKDIITKLQNAFSFLIEKNLITDDLAVACLNSLIETFNLFAKEVDDIYDDGYPLESIKYITLDKVRKLERMIASLTNDLNSKESQLKKKRDNNSCRIDIKAMKKYLDEIVVGQEEAKINVISVLKMNQLIDDYHFRKSCFLTGPTGSGKTILMEAVASYLDKVVEIYDASKLTSAGYKGSDLTEILENLMAKSNGDLEKAQEGIVVLNEIDKKGSDTENPAYRGVLNELLSFVEGTTYKVEYEDKTYNFDTRNLTIFFAGSFERLLSNKSNSDYKRGDIGFHSSLEGEEEHTKYYKKLELEDLRELGGIPNELLGRIVTIVQLEEQTKKSLRKILTDSKMSCLLAEQRALKNGGVALRWTDGYLDAVAESALALKTGSRSLNATVEKSILMARMVALSNPGQYNVIYLTEDAVKDNQECLLMDKKGNRYKAREIMNGMAKQEETQSKTYSKKSICK